MDRVTCPSCSLQFEPSGRRPHCPICGARVRSVATPSRSLFSRTKWLRLPVFFIVVAAAILLHVPGILVSVGLFITFCAWAISQIGAREPYAAGTDARYLTGYDSAGHTGGEAGGGFEGGDG